MNRLVFGFCLIILGGCCGVGPCGKEVVHCGEKGCTLQKPDLVEPSP